MYGRNAPAINSPDSRTDQSSTGTSRARGLRVRALWRVQCLHGIGTLAGRRLTKVTESRTKVQWAHFVQDIAQAYPDAQRITLVMDNLNTHTAAALYETFPAPQAKAL